jgi:hypothetical protein
MKKLGLLIHWWSVRWWLVGMIVIVLAVSFKALTLFEGLQILITYTLVLITAQYAKSTDLMAKTMEAELATRRPYLTLDNWHLPEPTNPKLWRVNMRNFGNTPAYAVQLEIKPRLIGYQGILEFRCTSASALIMPNQWNEWTINLGDAPEIASQQHARLEIEFVIRYRNAGHKPFKAWELKLVRTPDPTISNWDLVGEDSETELVSEA